MEGREIAKHLYLSTKDENKKIAKLIFDVYTCVKCCRLGYM